MSERTCIICTAVFETTSTGVLGATCSRSCYAKHTRFGDRAHDVLACAECGDTWQRWTKGRATRFCSLACNQRATKRRGNQLRDRRVRRAPLRETIDIAVLAERDGWQCHLCADPVDRLTWSIDHVIPLAHGGHHTYANVALAHHLCNALRRDLPLAA